MEEWRGQAIIIDYVKASCPSLLVRRQIWSAIEIISELEPMLEVKLP
jgi:hypothetical protein